MNREWTRSIQHLPAKQFYEVISSTIANECEKSKSYTFYNLATAMFTALRRRYGFGGDELHSIAQDAVDISNGLETPSELDAILFEETGFSAYEPPSQSKLKYIPRGEWDAD